MSVSALLDELPRADEAARAAVQGRARNVLRPSGAFQRLDDIAAWLASWQSTERPKVCRPALVVFVGDHGVCTEGVSAYPAHVTRSMLDALRAGVATATALAADSGTSVEVVDTGVGQPTGNITLEPGLTHDLFASCFEIGRAAIRRIDADIVVLGEMGIGNTTPAAAVAMSIFGGSAAEWTGRGTGIDDASLERKIAVVHRACERAGRCDPLESLRQLGGTELVAIAGAVVEARIRRLPVLLDGFVVTAAVAPLEVVRRGALDHCLAAHRSPEPGHSLLLEKLRMDPLLDLGLRLGEGSGALVALPLVRMAARAVVDVATFQEWGLTR
jgi:nicotinate-nucleotide--dimethylbenzimidazole phosphoribosyltransferase